MKSVISLFLVVICTVVLAAQSGQAKKGCSAYGHVCYGGHGKRSLALAAGNVAAGLEQDDGRPDAVLQMMPNDLSEGELDAYPRYRLIKIMKSWFGGNPRRQQERLNDFDYGLSNDGPNRDLPNAFN